MSNATCPDYFRRRTLGRAPSPPTWACYEQIPYDDGYSDSGSEDNSCSEDEEDYGRCIPRDSDSDGDHSVVHSANQESRVDRDMEIDEGDEAAPEDKLAELKKDVKGKQRAIEPEHDSPKRQLHRKHRQPQIPLRPILTIQRSQGFVWNQASTLNVISDICLLTLLLRRTCSCHHISRIDVRFSSFVSPVFDLLTLLHIFLAPQRHRFNLTS
ncbi:unnamed protein product [Somion occarium]|uniref:Uncharacterized protein n=1 Tax=Somion occarium TaxID=3059160 RepID=A0ABP1E8A9_9APHY